MESSQHTNCVTSKSEVLTLRGITVRYPGTLACDRVNLSLARGEVHSLVGENGAGKSSLMHVAAGLVQPTSGEIFLDGTKVRLSSPRVARSYGITMVFQDFLLVDRLTVLDNVLLSVSSLEFFPSRRKAIRRLETVCSQLGIDLDPLARVGDLSVGEKQKVALARALFEPARILILDEPTAALTPKEADSLLATVRRLRDSGVSILFVSHKLPEIMAISDRISVMHEGRMVATGVDATSVSVHQIAGMMVGERINGKELPLPAELSKGRQTELDKARDTVGLASSQLSESNKLAQHPPALELDHVSLVAGGVALLKDISFCVQAGEIVGVAGVAGNGQRELASVCAGICVPSAGRVLVHGADLTGMTPAAFYRAGVRYVCEDRRHEGTDGRLTVVETCGLKWHREMVKGPFRFLDRKQMERATVDVIQRFNVKTPGLYCRASSLSGGNLQKLLVGRELEGVPRLLVVHQPTRGLDLSSTAMIHELLRRRAEGTAAVLLISSDLDEILSLSSSIIVLYRGRITGRFEESRFDRRLVGECMAGLRAKAAL